MTWVDYFVLAIIIGAALRIVVIVIKEDSATKMTAPFHWLLSILLLSASWFLLGVIFPSFRKNKMKLGGGQNIEQKYERKDGQTADTIHIRVRPKKK